jgi:hypothetical protein
MGVEERRWILALLGTLLPVRLRSAGLLNDVDQVNDMERLSLADIAVPTLL